MSIKVPIYGSRTNRITPTVSIPQELRPPEAAFGGGVAEALQNLGETGQKIAGLMVQRAQERQKELMVRDNLNKDTAFGQTMMEVQYSDELDDNGRPKGLLNRKLESAHGISTEFNQTYYKMRKQLLDGVKDPEQQDALSRMLDSRFESIQNRVVNHERQQTDESIKVAHESSQALQENDAAQLRDGPSLINAIGKAVVFNNDYNRFMGYDPDTAKVKNGEAATKIVKSAVLSTFNTNGFLPAQRLLNDVQDRIPKPAFDDLSKQIEIDAKQTTERVRFQAMVAQDQTESGLIDKYFQGQLTRDEVKQLHFNRQISDSFAKAMMNNLNSVEKISAKPNSSTFNKLADFILADNKQDDIRIELLNENAKGEITDDDFKILNTFNQAVTKDTLEKVMPKKGFLQAISFWSDEYAQRRPEVKAQMFKEYMQKVSAGDDPQVTVDKIIRSQINNDIIQAASGMTTKNTKIEAKIKQLQDEGWSPERIKKALQEKGIDPETYNLYGLRSDNTPKGEGYFGELKVAAGVDGVSYERVATEISVEVEFDGKKTLIPTLIPTLTQKEIDYLLNGGKPTEAIIKKAVAHARKRMSEGKSPFAQKGEQEPRE